MHADSILFYSYEQQLWNSNNYGTATTMEQQQQQQQQQKLQEIHSD
jgi:hypothetical protein